MIYKLKRVAYIETRVVELSADSSVGIGVKRWFGFIIFQYVYSTRLRLHLKKKKLYPSQFINHISR